MDSVLVVCYSYTGNSRRMAQLLCSQQGWPLGEITDVEPRSGGRGTWRCVLDSVLRRRPQIPYEGPEPGGFRAVLLVGPVWMGRLAGPMRAFVSQFRKSLRHHVAVLMTS